MTIFCMQIVCDMVKCNVAKFKNKELNVKQKVQMEKKKKKKPKQTINKPINNRIWATFLFKLNSSAIKI